MVLVINAVDFLCIFATKFHKHCFNFYICTLVAKMNKKKSSKADILGITASLTCAVHCSVLPLAIGYGLLSSTLMSGHGMVELIFVIISIAIASFTLWGSFQNKHRNPLPIFLFCIGICLVIIAIFNHGSSETILATTGGLMVAISHFFNIKLNRRIGNICYS